MRLIDADVLIEEFKKWLPKEGSEWLQCDIHPLENLSVSAILTIEEQPTVEAVPMVPGEWIKINNRPKTYIRKCSVCGRESYTCIREKDYDYCPWCGADMKPLKKSNAISEESEKTFGYALKEKLKEKRMSQRELSNATGITEVSISRYIKDERIPKLNALVKIADALGCTIDELIMRKKV